jgi:hypothetical protein
MKYHGYVDIKRVYRYKFKDKDKNALLDQSEENKKCSKEIK